MKTALALALLAICLTGASAECANACSGHGTCRVTDKCQCYRNWQSADCSERTCPFGLAFVDTPQGDLDGDGYVNKEDSAITGGDPEVTVTWSNAKQYEYWPTSGQANEAHFYRECSNKGLCNRKSGECECFDGYEGGACDRTVCPNACSGHGTCESIAELGAVSGTQPSVTTPKGYSLWDADKSFGCKCDAPWSGPDCSSRECPKGDDPLTVDVNALEVTPTVAAGTVDAASYAGVSTIDTITHDSGTHETQTLTIVGNVDALTTGCGEAPTNCGGALDFDFSLTFTDQFGDKWTTTKLSEASTSAQIRAALIALPNAVVEDIRVSTGTSGNNGKVYTFEFLDNHGDINQLTTGSFTPTLTGLGTGKDASVSAVFATRTGFTDTKSVHASAEEATCSNRGLCDYATGVCKCFRGYTDDDCSKQNALAY